MQELFKESTHSTYRIKQFCHRHSIEPILPKLTVNNSTFYGATNGNFYKEEVTDLEDNKALFKFDSLEECKQDAKRLLEAAFKQ